ncbi:MAG: ROK family protein, partial [Candidatus Saccharibacteria bacterium]|nr:ROK family protein [Pseudorhodobacter sp.]
FEDRASGRWTAAEGARAGKSGDARAVFAAAAEGQAWADEIVQTSARRVARLCHNLQLMFDPDLFVIGGGVGLAPGYMDRIVASVAHVSLLTRPEFIPAALGKDAGVIGVADLSTRNQPNRKDTT